MLPSTADGLVLEMGAIPSQSKTVLRRTSVLSEEREPARTRGSVYLSGDLVSTNAVVICLVGLHGGGDGRCHKGREELREIPCMTSRSSQIEIGPSQAKANYQDGAGSTYIPVPS